VQYKQGLSRKYGTETAALRIFDRYLREHAVADWQTIDASLINDFLKSRPRARPRTDHRPPREAALSDSLSSALIQE
jgi:hypothetical protein